MPGTFLFLPKEARGRRELANGILLCPGSLVQHVETLLVSPDRSMKICMYVENIVEILEEKVSDLLAQFCVMTKHKDFLLLWKLQPFQDVASRCNILLHRDAYCIYTPMVIHVYRRPETNGPPTPICLYLL